MKKGQRFRHEQTQLIAQLDDLCYSYLYFCVDHLGQTPTSFGKEFFSSSVDVFPYFYTPPFKFPQQVMTGQIPMASGPEGPALIHFYQSNTFKLIFDHHPRHRDDRLIWLGQDISDKVRLPVTGFHPISSSAPDQLCTQIC